MSNLWGSTIVERLKDLLRMRVPRALRSYGATELRIKFYDEIYKFNSIVILLYRFELLIEHVLPELLRVFCETIFRIVRKIILNSEQLIFLLILSWILTHPFSINDHRKYIPETKYKTSVYSHIKNRNNLVIIN